MKSKSWVTFTQILHQDMFWKQTTVDYNYKNAQYYYVVLCKHDMAEVKPYKTLGGHHKNVKILKTLYQFSR